MCDSSDTVEDLNRYYDEITEKNLDAVLGSRFNKGGKVVEYPFIKLIFNRIGNLIAKYLLWTDLNDFTNGFKIYKVVEKWIETNCVDRKRGLYGE